MNNTLWLVVNVGMFGVYVGLTLGAAASRREGWAAINGGVAALFALLSASSVGFVLGWWA